MMRLTIALGSLLLAAVAQAGDPSAMTKPCRHSVDANGDGVVTREEAAAHPPLAEGFETWDTNGDGQLDPAEMKAHHEAMHGEMRAKRHERWAAADADGNGSLSRAETEASMPYLAGSFDEIDADKDGQLARAEIHAYRAQSGHPMHTRHGERFKAADTDGDGAIDLAEAQVGLPGLAAQFSTVDANGDGKVTPDEMRAAKQSR